MGIGVGSAQVAQGVLDPEGACLEEKPLMRGPPAGGGDSQSDFERHVEAGCAAGELNATEIVKGVPAYGNQLQDAVQAPCAARDLERGPRAEPEGTETGNQGNEELFVTRVVGDVEKRVVRRVTLGDRSTPVCCSPPRWGPIPGAAFPAASQGVGDHCHQFQIALAGDAQHSGGCGRGGVGSRNHRARSQGHGLTLRSEGFSCQRPRKDTRRSARSTVPGAVTVDISVGSSEIAQGLLDPVRARLQEEPLVSGAPAGGGNGQADFEGHVEPRRAVERD